MFGKRLKLFKLLGFEVRLDLSWIFIAVLVIEPACRLHGKLGSKGLQEMGWPLDWTNVYLYWNDDRPLSHSSDKQQMEFWVPAGTYRLYAYGSAKHSDGAGKVTFSANTQSVSHTVTVKAGQAELDVGVIDLPPDRLYVFGARARLPHTAAFHRRFRCALLDGYRICYARSNGFALRTRAAP